MKKYILKQNLPTFDEGDIFEFSDKGLIRLPRTKDEKPILAYTKSTVEKFGFLEKEKGFFEEIPKKTKSVWDLKVGDIYYTFNKSSNVIEYYWVEDLEDINKRDSGFYFRTRKEAEKELEKRRAIQKIKRYCYENDINNVYNDNSVVFYINEDNDVRYWNCFRVGSPIGYFSYENAQKILDNFEEELKIILN